MLSTPSSSRWKRNLPGLTVIALFFLVFFRPVVFSHKFLVTSDAFNYLYPLRSVVWNELRHGRLPLWTKQIMSGYPLLSMAQIAVGYPLTWTYLFLPGYWAEQIYFLAPYLLAPAFTYAYLRTINRSQPAAVLGALAFSYGGFMISPLASYSGLAANALMWLPLMLVAIERARTTRFITALLLLTFVYTMSVTSGWGQGFAYSGLIALGYSICVSLFSQRKADSSRGLWSVGRWQPLWATLIAIMLAAGIDAFQILETMQAQRLSIRRELTYGLFAMGSYSLGSAVKSFFVPLHNVFEATAYVAPLVFILAMVGVGMMLARREREWRVVFWFAIALLGFLLMLGQNTPLTAIFYRLPPFNLFRGAARHAFEFTFAISLLSAYGWDAISSWVENLEVGASSSTRRSVFVAGAFLLLALLTGVLWMRDVAGSAVAYMELFFYPPKYPAARYLLWKFSFSLFCIVGMWLLLRVHKSFRFRLPLLYLMIALVCFVEPAIMVSRWWWPTLKPASRFTAVSPATRRLQSNSSAENRVYTHVYPMVEEYEDSPHLEPANLTMLHGLDNVAGNEPLILDRYSRALGDVYIDAVKTRPGYPTDVTLFDSESHVLDLLNTGFVVSYPYQATEPIGPEPTREIRINPRDLSITVDPGKSVTLKGAAAEADTLALVTATAWSAEAVDGAEVARVRLISAEGKVIERSLLLGKDTAEWSYDRPNVKPLIRHSLPQVFSSKAADPNDPEPAYQFQSLLTFGERMTVDHIEISNPSNKIVLLLSHATLYDSTRKFSMPLPHYDLKKWEPIYDETGALVLRNRNVLPRAWLVDEAKALNSERALLRIRGQDGPFDPLRTALLEVYPEDVPVLPGRNSMSPSNARITRYENNQMTVETTSAAPAVLIISEVNYPGWVASVDDVPARIYTADFLLRGIYVPAGSHRVEMRYTAPAARNGALISGVSLLMAAALCVYARRTRVRRA